MSNVSPQLKIAILMLVFVVCLSVLANMTEHIGTTTGINLFVILFFCLLLLYLKIRHDATE